MGFPNLVGFQTPELRIHSNVGKNTYSPTTTWKINGWNTIMEVDGRLFSGFQLGDF